jgi:hypothetical protein
MATLTFMERVSALRRLRRVHGKCAEAGCREESGEAYHCKYHAAMNAARVAKHRALKKQKARPSWG